MSSHVHIARCVLAYNTFYGHFSLSNVQCAARYAFWCFLITIYAYNIMIVCGIGHQIHLITKCENEVQPKICYYFCLINNTNARKYIHANTHTHTHTHTQTHSHTDIFHHQFVKISRQRAV